MVFHITPKDQPTIELRVDIEDGYPGKQVAVRIRDAFREQLSKKSVSYRTG